MVLALQGKKCRITAFLTEKCKPLGSITLLKRMEILLITRRPKEVAYRLIKDHLSLDGNPILNLASFVTTYMVSMANTIKCADVNTWI